VQVLAKLERAVQLPLQQAQMADFHHQQITVVGLVTYLLEMYLLVEPEQFQIFVQAQQNGAAALVVGLQNLLVAQHLTIL
jgi:hypothetical protein